jgi:hypothetical protein
MSRFSHSIEKIDNNVRLKRNFKLDAYTIAAGKCFPNGH